MLLLLMLMMLMLLLLLLLLLMMMLMLMLTPQLLLTLMMVMMTMMMIVGISWEACTFSMVRGDDAEPRRSVPVGRQPRRRSGGAPRCRDGQTDAEIPRRGELARWPSERCGGPAESETPWRCRTARGAPERYLSDSRSKPSSHKRLPKKLMVSGSWIVCADPLTGVQEHARRSCKAPARFWR